ncbi:GrlR family regulatory protein [Bradyrhizobium sp. UFLA05-153]
MPGIVSPDDAHNVGWGFGKGLKLREGLYKANFHTVHGTGCGVLYVTDGKLRGGNSAFAFIGTYTGEGESIKVKISTERYNDDPTFRPLFGTDRITLTLSGREDGEMAEFEGSALQLPGVAFRAVLTRISD